MKIMEKNHIDSAPQLNSITHSQTISYSKHIITFQMISNISFYRYTTHFNPGLR